MNVDQRVRRLGGGEQRVAGRDHLAQAFADDEQDVRSAHARRQLRIHRDADFTGVVRMGVVDDVLVAKRAGDGQRIGLDEAPEVRAGGGSPSATAGDDQRCRRASQQLAQGSELGRRWCRLGDGNARRVDRIHRRRQHVLR